jgi:hypothetical protein
MKAAASFRTRFDCQPIIHSDYLRGFVARPASLKDIVKFGFKEAQTDAGFDYVSNRRTKNLASRFVRDGQHTLVRRSVKIELRSRGTDRIQV